MRLYAYLTFNGCCREAMTWYRDCLGGELRFQEAGSSLYGNNMPEQMKRSILHAVLDKGTLQLFGTDMTSDEGLVKGNAVSLALEFDNETELRRCYRQLASGGRLSHPPRRTVTGSLTGSITDKYGNNWILHCDSGREIKNNVAAISSHQKN